MLKISRGLVLTTNWKWLIRLAWGDRILHSESERSSAYPSEVAASIYLWWSWIRSGGRLSFLVDPPQKVKITEEERPPTPKRLAPLEIDSKTVSDLIARRDKLRAEKRYKESDDIRDRLIAMGVEIRDLRID